jgi:hypothetical protein
VSAVAQRLLTVSLETLHTASTIPLHRLSNGFKIEPGHAT